MKLPLIILLSLSWTLPWCIASAEGWSDEVAHIRDFFYMGGQYISDGAGGHVFSDQMYVERLQPSSGIKQDYPIVLMHGQAQTGTVRYSQLTWYCY
jgi:hypothetical protein